MKRRVVLLIMDGWGLRDDSTANAVKLARTPVVDGLLKAYPHTRLDPSGRAVGLPDGQMGNSEVGHLNLGAGRVVRQDIVRVSDAINDGSFFENEALLRAVRTAQSGGTLHLMGLLSSGGVHSMQSHLEALVELAARNDLARVRVHAFMDGRDTSPTGGLRCLADLQAVLDRQKTGAVASVMGRYHAMDRDKRWDRTRKAYYALRDGEGLHTADYAAAVKRSYDAGVTDEFIEPIIVVDANNEPIGRVKDGDAVVFFNFRADRARQITQAFTDPAFDGFDRRGTTSLTYVCMTEYRKDFDLPVAIRRSSMKNILGEAASAAGHTSFRIAETEKYAHVTYFFNGGNETPYGGEDRMLIPSPKVATYDETPRMSAAEVTDTLIATLVEKRHDYIICNLANPDMVGHTGVLEAAIEAVETVDTCVGRIIDALDLNHDVAIVTADHGNAEMMIDPETGGPHTAHTTNPVPCILVDKHYRGELIETGALRDIAPTICNYLGTTPPEEMTGRDLRKNLQDSGTSVRAFGVRRR